jgi:hypothetical protein
LWGRTQDHLGLPCFSRSLLDLDCKYPTSWAISLMEKSLQSGEPVMSKNSYIMGKSEKVKQRISRMHIYIYKANWWVYKPKIAQFLPFRLTPAPPGGQLKKRTAPFKRPSKEELFLKISEFQLKSSRFANWHYWINRAGGQRHRCHNAIHS